jgi:hypothetical protein
MNSTKIAATATNEVARERPGLVFEPAEVAVASVRG